MTCNYQFLVTSFNAECAKCHHVRNCCDWKSWDLACLTRCCVIPRESQSPAAFKGKSFILFALTFFSNQTDPVGSRRWCYLMVYKRKGKVKGVKNSPPPPSKLHIHKLESRDRTRCCKQRWRQFALACVKRWLWMVHKRVLFQIVC